MLGVRPTMPLAVSIAVSLVMAAAPSPLAAQVAPGSVRNGQPLDVGYFIATGLTADGVRAADQELATWAIRAWARTIGTGVRLVPADEESALVRVYWAGPSGGQYGEMRPLSVSGRAGAAVYIRPDITALGADISERAGRDALLRDTIVYLTCVHELGHAFGLRHTSEFVDIMYSFQFGGDISHYFERYRRQLSTRADIARRSGLSDADVRAVRERFAAR